MESLNAKEEENICAICLLFICEPIQLPCAHTFCKYCLEKLKDNDPNELICPLCRNSIPVQFKLSINKTIENEFLLKNKEIYQKRIKEVEKLRLEDGFFEKIKLFYGNNHEIVENKGSNNIHQWTFFIKGEIKSKWQIKEIIKKVEVELDPTFGGVPLLLRGDNMEIKRRGFGEFTIVFKIFWQKWLKMEPVTLEHHLNFMKQTTKKVFVLKVNKEVVVNAKNNKI